MKKQQERRSGRKWRVALVAAALGLALAGCSASAASSHEHEWEAATCETPRVCKTCGETAGPYLAGGHLPCPKDLYRVRKNGGAEIGRSCVG